MFYRLFTYKLQYISVTPGMGGNRKFVYVGKLSGGWPVLEYRNNISSSHPVYSYVDAGMGYWVSTGLISATPANILTAKITHKVAGELAWYLKFGSNYYVVTAYTEATSDVVLTPTNAYTASLRITSADIVYNPYASSYNAVTAKTIVAHEIGHCLGFGENDSSQYSIMAQGYIHNNIMYRDYLGLFVKYPTS